MKFHFTERDIRILKQIASQARSLQYGQEIQRPPDLYTPQDILIGKVAEGETWDASDYANTPHELGTYELPIYNIIDDTEFPVMLEVGVPWTVEAYNLSESEITDANFVAIQRTRFGIWVLQAGGGGSCDNDRSEAWTLQLRGAPDSGSFAVTMSLPGIGEQTISTIPYNITAGDFQILVENAFFLDPADGDFVVTGGPLPYEPLTIAFGGQFENKTIVNSAFDIPTLNSFGLFASLGGGPSGDFTRWVGGFGS